MIMYMAKISCDICLVKSVTVPDGSGELISLPKGWHDTVNRNAQTTDKEDSYCLAGVKIICDTCHEKLMALRDQIRKEAAPRNDRDQAEPDKLRPLKKQIRNPNIVWEKDSLTFVPLDATDERILNECDGCPVFYDNRDKKWRICATHEIIDPTKQGIVPIEKSSQ